MDKSKLKFVCTREELDQLDYLVRPIEYRNNKTTAVVFMFLGQLYAYINRCMHMQRRLDCEADTIFDSSGRLLHCSMHGFVFEPTTGECLSPVCAGHKLQALKIVERDGTIYFSDKHVKLIGQTPVSQRQI
ncbi:MAG: Rieske (2Fe-2S) protein [Gammaproteobacteria bacterium]